VAADIAELTPRSLVLDGEVAIFDEHLRFRFEWLRRTKPDALATLPLFIAFDLLYRNGADETIRPLQDRRVLLEDAIKNAAVILPARRLADNGLDAWAQVVGRGYEGYVAKDVLSPYRGVITRSWPKVKVPGWTDPEDRFRRARISSE
jgi:bifunctional non-homologous end joining protein LigD